MPWSQRPGPTEEKLSGSTFLHAVSAQTILKDSVYLHPPVTRIGLAFYTTQRMSAGGRANCLILQLQVSMAGCTRSCTNSHVWPRLLAMNGDMLMHSATRLRLSILSLAGLYWSVRVCLL